MEFIARYLEEVTAVAARLDREAVERLIVLLAGIRDGGGRLFVLGDGGYTARVADVCVIVPTIQADTVTAHSESFQAVIWHLLVSDPRLQRAPMKWESLER